MRLSFPATDLHSMYYEDGHTSSFACTKSTKESFIDTVNILRAMPSMECLLKKWRCLDAKPCNLTLNSLSVRVDKNHRLEISYSPTFNELTIICLLRVPVTQPTSA
jgi:hypothetical protein